MIQEMKIKSVYKKPAHEATPHSCASAELCGQKKRLITAPTKNWRFSAPQTHLWLIKHWFSASTFVVKIANFL